MLGLAPFAGAAPGDLDLSFNPGGAGDFEDGVVGAMARQPDGKLLVAGDFTQFRGEPRIRIARLNVDGSVDPGFNSDGTGPDGRVHQIRVLPDDKILIAGEFTEVDGVTKTRMARLDSSGNVDPTFTGNFNGFVRDIELVSQGRILVAGDFDEANGLPRNRMALLSSSGFPEGSFTSPISSTTTAFVNEMALQPDGMLVVGGQFSVVGDTRKNLVRIDPGGEVDEEFEAVEVGLASIQSVAVDSAGRVLIAGSFEQADGAARNGLARLDADGNVDPGFFAGQGGNRFAQKTVRARSDGKVLVYGSFNSFSGVPVPGGFIQLNADGSVDDDFVTNDPLFQDSARVLGDSGLLVASEQAEGGGVSRSVLVLRPIAGADESFPSPNTFLPGIEGGWVNSIAVQDDGKVLVAGFFGKVQGNAISMLARLHPDGRVEESFGPFSDDSDPRGYDVALQGDGRILFAGRWGSTVRRNLTRFGADGSAMAGFSTVFGDFGGLLKEVRVQPDGRILVAGVFSEINGVPRANVGRLLYDGATDSSFLNGLSGVDTGVEVMALQPDGKVLLGGSFTSVNGMARANLARLEPDGSVDEGFLDGMAGPDGYVAAIALAPDGKIVIGGEFESVNGSPRAHFARLGADGSLDPDFASGVGGTDRFVNALAVKSDGRVVIGGPFTEVDGIARAHLAQLNGNGSVDTTFLASQRGISVAGSNPVEALAIDADGKLLVGGNFLRINGVDMPYLARLEGDGSGGVPAPQIEMQPVAVDADPGDEVVLSVEVAGLGSFRYQWFKDGAALADGEGIEGATTAMLRLADAQVSAAGSYRVVVGGVGGTATSETVAVSFPRVPVPRNDLAERDPDASVRIPIADLLSNDTNPAGGGLSFDQVEGSSGGLVYVDGAEVVFESDIFFPVQTTGFFDYRVRNSLGVTAVATVTVLVRDSENDVAGTIAGATVLEGGELQLEFEGTPGENYVIQTADRLEQPNWITLATVAADEQGRIVFSPPGGLQARAFFLVHPVF